MFEANKAVVQRVVDEIINQGNLDLADELFSPNYHSHQYLIRGEALSPDGVHGPDSIKQEVGSIRAAFSDLHLVTDLMIAEKDTVVARVTETGTQSDTFLGIAPTGKSFARTSIHWLRFEDGKIAEQWALGDDLGMMRQLGIVPAPK